MIMSLPRIALAWIVLVPGALPAGDLPPIERVEVLPPGALSVNGKPFFPRMCWLQDPGNFPSLKACGMNTVAGYWPRSGGTRDAKEYLDRAWASGLYGVMPFHRDLKGHPALLGYIHADEPDLPHLESSARVEPGPKLRINKKTPLWKLIDGDLFSWSVLDPLEGASVTIRPGNPVKAERVAVWLTVSSGLSLAREIAFEADGREILRAGVEAKKGRQAFDLPGPVTFEALTVRVVSTVPGSQVWGSLGEIEAFDGGGKNVLLSPPRSVPRAQPAETLKRYEEIKAHDPDRPVFLTLTGYFHPIFKKWSEGERNRLYPAYIRAADVVGYDIYPIYGWNKPEWIHLVHEATGLLAAMAGERPIYAWIETSKGGQWTGALERQKDVTPRHIRAEVWMAICRGASNIGYFTHVWKPSYSQFGVPPENRKALARINARIGELTPVLLGPGPERKVSIEAAGGVKVDCLARKAGGELYIFTVHFDEKDRGVRARILAEGLQAGTEITVLHEDRSLRSEMGFFTDDFEPLAVHIYRLPPP